ncbi:restriction endonuclease subunit S [Vibrio cholerae]
MSQLPEGWTAARLEEIVPHDAIISDGDWVESKDQDPTGNVRLIQLADIGDGDFKDKSQRFMNEEAASRLNCSYLSKGDLLVARMPDPLGRACLFPGVGQKAVTVVDVCFIQEKILSALSNKLLMHWINSPIIRGEISANASGSTRKRITRKKLEKFSFPIPPLAEQTRIVEKLDEVLAQVDTIKARLDGIPAILKRFRQSVLAAAVSGKLTEEWRGECDYIENSLGEGWKWGAMPSNWTAKFYPELVDSRLGKMLDKNKNVGKATKYLGNINVRWFGTDLSNVQEILVSDKEQEELSLSKGDVLICEGGEPGRCCVWSKDSDEVIVFQKALHRARVKKEMVSEWLVYNLKNDADGLILNQLFTGTTIKHLTGKALKNYPIRVPPIEEQKEIVRLVDQYFAFADTIEAQVKKAQARVDKLTQSILAKAFRGELVPQDPSDEPADKLLERIAAARKEAEALAKAAKKAAQK